jgi:hypothetical protein
MDLTPRMGRLRSDIAFPVTVGVAGASAQHPVLGEDKLRDPDADVGGDAERLRQVGVAYHHVLFVVCHQPRTDEVEHAHERAQQRLRRWNHRERAYPQLDALLWALNATERGRQRPQRLEDVAVVAAQRRHPQLLDGWRLPVLQPMIDSLAQDRSMLDRPGLRDVKVGRLMHGVQDARAPGLQG